MVRAVPATGAFGLSGQEASSVPGWASGWQASVKVGPNMDSTDESRPQWFDAASAQHAGIVKFWMGMTTASQAFAPQLTGSVIVAVPPAPPLVAALPALPLPPASAPLLPPILLLPPRPLLPPPSVLGVDELPPHAGATIERSTPQMPAPRTVRQSMAKA